MAIKSRSSDGAVQNAVSQVDSMHFFNLLTSPELPDELGTLLPECRERRYPPAVALAMFLGQVSSADGSCQNAVNEAVVSRLLSGPQVQSTATGAYRIPHVIYSDAYSSEMVAYADLVFPDTT